MHIQSGSQKMKKKKMWEICYEGMGWGNSISLWGYRRRLWVARVVSNTVGGEGSGLQIFLDSGSAPEEPLAVVSGLLDLP